MLRPEYARRQVFLVAVFMFRKLFITILIPILLGYGALVGYVYAIQDQLAFYPWPEHVQRPADFGLQANEHKITTIDGERLHAWFFRRPASGLPYVLLYSHGNAGNLSHNLSSIRQFQQLGLAVFVYDYRGYGRSTGQPDENGLYRDGEAAYRYLRDQLEVPAERIIVFGRSLGGAIAVHLAVQNPVRALVLESTFTSAVDVGAEVYWYLPVSLLARHRFESRERLLTNPLRDFRGEPLPLLVIHSRFDALIPFAHGRSLFAAARTNRKTFVEIEGGHNDGFLISKKIYEASFAEFLNRLSRDE